MEALFTLKWDHGKLILLDQTKLPGQVSYRSIDTVEGVWEAVRVMQVRGAPAIGIAAAYGMVIAANKAPVQTFDEFWGEYKKAGDYLATSRPTAVNLFWALERMEKKALEARNLPMPKLRKVLEEEALAIHLEDEEINRRIGENLLTLLKDGDTVLTHCNAGRLATSKYGTALSPLYLAREKGMNIKAYADETRPRLQGALLTSFELSEAGIDVTLICDNMAAVVMSQGKIDAVITGCDRVAANGDSANKIGTLGVSILAKHFNIPMYIAAPTPTIDLNCPSGKDIPIEERDSREITCTFGTWTAPRQVKTYNPAFDVTPAENITAIVTERGIVYPPYSGNLKMLFNS